jgi:putative membrane protein
MIDRATSTAPAPASHDRYSLVLGMLFGLLWAALAINPRYRADWALENALTVAFVAALILFRRRLPLSRISYTALVLFLTLHSVGAHYTYAEVPYDAWIRALTGRSLGGLLGWERNHYDRFVHFSYGFLFAYPIREGLVRVAGAGASGATTCRSPSRPPARPTSS